MKIGLENCSYYSMASNSSVIQLYYFWWKAKINPDYRSVVYICNRIQLDVAECLACCYEAAFRVVILNIYIYPDAVWII